MYFPANSPPIWLEGLTSPVSFRHSGTETPGRACTCGFFRPARPHSRHRCHFCFGYSNDTFKFLEDLSGLLSVLWPTEPELRQKVCTKARAAFCKDYALYESNVGIRTCFKAAHAACKQGHIPCCSPSALSQYWVSLLTDKIVLNRNV